MVSQNCSRQTVLADTISLNQSPVIDAARPIPYRPCFSGNYFDTSTELSHCLWIIFLHASLQILPISPYLMSHNICTQSPCRFTNSDNMYADNRFPTNTLLLSRSTHVGTSYHSTRSHETLNKADVQDLDILNCSFKRFDYIWTECILHLLGAWLSIPVT